MHKPATSTTGASPTGSTRRACVRALPSLRRYSSTHKAQPHPYASPIPMHFAKLQSLAQAPVPCQRTASVSGKALSISEEKSSRSVATKKCSENVIFCKASAGVSSVLVVAATYGSRALASARLYTNSKEGAKGEKKQRRRQGQRQGCDIYTCDWCSAVHAAERENTT